jgi:hypothetical protein
VERTVLAAEETNERLRNALERAAGRAEEAVRKAEETTAEAEDVVEREGKGWFTSLSRLKRVPQENRS